MEKPGRDREEVLRRSEYAFEGLNCHTHDRMEERPTPGRLGELEAPGGSNPHLLKGFDG
jgi:hypothetical protein